MNFIRMIIGLPILAVILLFAFVNNELVTFVLWPELEVTASFSVVVISLILIGFVLGRISAWFSYIPLRSKMSMYKKQNKQLCKEHEKACNRIIDLQDNAEYLREDDGIVIKKRTLKEKLVKVFKSPEKEK